MEKIKPLIWDGESLLLLDQRLLPHKEVYVRCHSAEEAGKAIRDMVVRGAPAIGVAAAFAMVMAAKAFLHGPAIKGTAPFDWSLFIDKLTETATFLKNIRPTAVNLAWGVEQILKQAITFSGTQPLAAAAKMEALARDIYAQDIAVNMRIRAYGAELLPSPAVS